MSQTKVAMKKRNREWDEHRVNGMTRNARCAARVCHSESPSNSRSDGKRVDATEGSERLFQQVETEGAKISYFCNTHRKDATEKNNLRTCRLNGTALNTAQGERRRLESDRRGLVPWNKSS